MKLEQQLVRTYHMIERMLNKHQDNTRVKRFYCLIHRFEHLHDLYVAKYHRPYNPAIDSSMPQEHGDVQIHD